MLSDNFKQRNHCCKPDGSFDDGPYIAWWDSIDNIKILKVDTRAQTVGNAVIDISLRYYRKDGRIVDSTHTFNLIRNSTSKSWLID